MRIFVTGATGFIGSAIVPELIDAGHEVVGLARSEQSVAALQAAGAEAHRGSLEDLDSLRSGAAAADGVIHCAFIHDFSALENSAVADRHAIDALGATLAGSDRPFVITSGTGHARATGTERDMPDADARPNHRVASEQMTLALASQGVRTSIVRLPPSVHGEGDHAFVPAIINIARAKGVSAYIGDGANRWPAVHRLDAATLFRLGLESAPAGSILHGVGDEGIPTREIAEVIGRELDVPVISVAPDQAADHFGWLAAFFGLDVPASSALTRELLGWESTQPGLIADLEEGHYFVTASV